MTLYMFCMILLLGFVITCGLYIIGMVVFGIIGSILNGIFSSIFK